MVSLIGQLFYYSLPILDVLLVAFAFENVTGNWLAHIIQRAIVQRDLGVQATDLLAIVSSDSFSLLVDILDCFVKELC